MRKLLRLLVSALASAMLFSACAGTDSSIIDGAGGNATILATGGTGSAAGGGNGTWYMHTYSIKGVTIAKTGTVEASFSVPAYNPLVSFGTTSATISADTTVAVLSAGADADAGAGVLYMVSGIPKLYLGTGVTSTTLPIVAQEVTGLKLESGVTLTLGLNMDTDGAGGLDTAEVTFADDVDIYGHLKTADLGTSVTGTLDGTALDMGGLVLSANGVFIRGWGTVTAKGLDGTAEGGERGGNGGYISITADNYLVNEGIIDNSGGNSNDTTGTSQTNGGNAGYAMNGSDALVLTSNGAVINRGPINANGGSGANGGDSCDVVLAAEDTVYNTYSITANGGTGYNGTGGNFEWVWKLDLLSAHASVYNSAALSATGGNGTAGGGNGAFARLVSVPSTTTGTGDLINSGPIYVNGGHAMTEGSGGSGGALNFYAHGGIKNSADLYLNGGNGTGLGVSLRAQALGAAGPLFSNTGGNGGSLSIEATVPVDAGKGEQLAVKPIQISGNISLAGGAGYGSVGGQGGYFTVIQDEAQSLYDLNIAPYTATVTVADGGIYLMGYAVADLSAGNGIAAGGSAVSGINTAAGFGTAYVPVLPSASMEIHTYPTRQYLLTSGPTPTYVLDQNGNRFEDDDTPAGPIINEIGISIRGGNASDAAGMGGTGGSLVWETGNSSAIVQNSGGVTVVNNSGAIDLSGGFGYSNGGGSAFGLAVYGDDGVSNSGMITVKGGDSSGGTGGDGALNSVTLASGRDIVNTAMINASGGSGDIGGAGSSVNDGGGVLLDAGGSVATSGSLIANGGAGNVANGNGGTVELRNTTTSFGDIQVFAGNGGGTPGSNGTITIDGMPYNPVY